MYTKHQLIEQIEQLGIRPEDLLCVHISLKSVGAICAEGRTSAEVMIEALRYCVRDGLLLIPSYTYSNIREYPVFDVRNTLPCIGAVPTVAVQLANQAYDRSDPTVMRSLHPAHSVVAFGKNACDYIRDDERAATPMPPFGSHRKLYDHKGKILLIGVGLTNCTFIHAIDEYMEPDGISAPYAVDVIDYGGRRTPRFACNCKGPSRTYGKYMPALEESGAVTFGKIGDADAALCGAVEMFDSITAVWKDLNGTHAGKEGNANEKNKNRCIGRV